MKKTHPRTKQFAEYLKGNKRDASYNAALDRARLRVAIAREIKTIRESAGLTQGELAGALGLKQSVIGRLESLKDKRLPSLDLLARIASVTKKRLVVDQAALHLELMVHRPLPRARPSRAYTGIVR